MTYTSSSSSSTGTSSSSSSNLFSSSSSSGFCKFPECVGENCQYFSNWNIEGLTQETLPNGIIYILFNAFGPDQQIELYSDPNYFDLIAIARGAAGTLSFTERNDSGVNGSVTWNGTAVNAGETAILYCDDVSSSTSTSSLDSSSSSSESSYSTESSSSDCCEAVIADGEDAIHFSSWNIIGMKDANSDNCTLYIGLEYVGGYQQLKVYKDVTLYNLVAIGQSGIAGTISLTQVNSSGLSGSVDWNGTPINYPSVITLACSPFSSSSSESSTSIDSSSSSSIDSSSSSTSNSSSTSTSSLDSSSSTSESSVEFSSSSSYSSLSISSKSSLSSSTSSSESFENISSSSSTESAGNESSSSSSSIEIWNKSKPLSFANAITGDEYSGNKVAQAFQILTENYNIGKIYIHLNGPYGDITSSTLEAHLYSGDSNGHPDILISTKDVNCSEIDKSGWYGIEFNASGTMPDSKYLCIVLTTSSMDNNNYATWSYDNNAVLNAPSFIYQNSGWKTIPDICRAIKVNEPFDIFNLNDYRIETNSAQSIIQTNSINTENGVFENSEVNNGKISIKNPNTMLSFVVDSSGSMGWNDRSYNRTTLIKKIYEQMSSFYPANFRVDIVKFGSTEIDVERFNSLNESVAYSNIDANTPTRTTYTFTLDSKYELHNGAIYEINGVEFTVCSGGLYRETMYAMGNEDPITTTGTLTKTSGNGSATINYTDFVKATISDNVIAYGLKNMGSGRTYIFAGFFINNVEFTDNNLVNSNLFYSYSAPSISLLNNGPKDIPAINIISQGDTVFRKSVLNYETGYWNLADNVNVGQDTISIDSFDGTLQERYDIIDGSIASVFHAISSDFDLTPSAEHNIAGSSNKGIVKISGVSEARQINETTINLLIKEANETPVTFFLQTANGLNIEWDVTPFSDWKYNNLFWFGESADIVFSAFDKNQNPLPDGTRIDVMVDAEIPSGGLTFNLASDALVGEDKIYLETTEYILKEAIFDITDNINFQTLRVSEIGEDSEGKYILTYETLEQSYLVADGARLIDKKSNALESEASVGQRVDIPLPMVDVTPIFTNKDIDPALLKSYDGVQVPSYESYNNLNYNGQYFKFKLIDLPSIDGYGVARILPITEDNISTIEDQRKKTLQLMNLSREDDFTSQIERSDTTTPTPIEQEEIIEKDYAIDSPVYTESGLAKSTMTSFSKTFESKNIEGITIPGVEAAEIFTRTYQLTPKISLINNLGDTSSSIYLPKFKVDFAISTNISSIKDGSLVYYWKYIDNYDAENPLSEEPTYVKSYFNGVYAMGDDFNIKYIVSEKLNLVKSENLKIKVYANTIVNLDDISALFKPVTAEAGFEDSDDLIPMSKQFIHIPVEQISTTDEAGNVVTNSKDSEITAWRKAVESNEYSRKSNTDINYYTGASEWVLAKQFTNYQDSLEVINGIANLNLAQSEKPCLLMIESSLPLETNNSYEVVRCDFFFVASPIVIDLIEPFSSIPSTKNKIFEKNISIKWMGEPIEDGTSVEFAPKTTFLEPNVGLTTNGVAGGFKFGPKAILIKGQEDIVPPIEDEDVIVSVYHSSGANATAIRKILWKSPEEETVKNQFFIKSDTINQEVWADGDDSHEIRIDLNSDTNKSVYNTNDGFVPKIWVGEYGIERLLGLEQPDNQAARFNTKLSSDGETSVYSPATGTWQSSPIIIKGSPINKNIGEGITQKLEIKTSYSFDVNGEKQVNTGFVSSSTPIETDDLLGSGESRYEPVKPKRIIKEPLSMEISLEEYDSTFVRDGVSTGRVVAEIKWKGNFIKHFVILNEGQPTETRLKFNFPSVSFKAGTCAEENSPEDGNKPIDPRGPAAEENSPEDGNKLIDPRGPASACLTIKNNSKITLSSYATTAGLFRTDIYDDGTGNIHTHACTVDENGNGMTTETIVLAGSVIDHEHIINNYVVDSEHSSLRCVAITTLNPVDDPNVDIKVNAYAIYDPTNCEPLSTPSRFAMTKVPYKNRKTFNTLSIDGALGVQPKLTIDLGIGSNLNKAGPIPSHYPEMQPDGTIEEVEFAPNFYSAKNIEETIKGIDIKARAYYSSYMNGTTLMPEVDVPDGTRIIIKTDVFKAQSNSGFNSISEPPTPYVLINIDASVTLNGEFASKQQQITILSLSQSLPITEALTSQPTNDSFDINGATSRVDSFGASQMYDGIVVASQRALQYGKDNNLENYQHIIFVLSDADENTSTYSINQSLTNVNFINGKLETPIVFVKLGKTSILSDLIVKKLIEETSGVTAYMNEFTDAQVDEVKSSILVNNALKINSGTYTDIVELDANANVKTFNIKNYIVSTEQDMLYRIQTSLDGMKWSNWSEWLEIDKTISGDIYAKYIRYEVYLNGDDQFNSPEIVDAPEIEHIKERETIVYFNRIPLNIKNNQYVNSVNITHAGTIPSTSKVEYGITHGISEDIEDFYGDNRGWIKPNEYSIILSRFREDLYTTDNRIYTAINGRWPKFSNVEVYCYSATKPSGELLDNDEYIIDSFNGKIIFNEFRSSSEFFTINIEMPPEIRLICKITNFGLESAMIDHIGLIYSVGTRT